MTSIFKTHGKKIEMIRNQSINGSLNNKEKNNDVWPNNNRCKATRKRNNISINIQRKYESSERNKNEQEHNILKSPTLQNY